MELSSSSADALIWCYCNWNPPSPYSLFSSPYSALPPGWCLACHFLCTPPPLPAWSGVRPVVYASPAAVTHGTNPPCNPGNFQHRVVFTIGELDLQTEILPPAFLLRPFVENCVCRRVEGLCLARLSTTARTSRFEPQACANSFSS